MAIVIPAELDTSSAESSLDRLKRAAREAADKVKGSFKGTADGFEDLGDAVGLPVDKIKKLSGAMSLLASPIGIVGVSVAAVAVGFVAAAAAGAALIAGVVKLTESSAKAIPGLLKLQDASGVKLFSTQDTDRVLTADAAIQSVGASASATGVAISSDLAPYVTEAAVLLTSLNLALGDFISKNDSLVQGLVKVGEAIVNAFFAPLQGAAVVMAGFLAQAATLVGLVNKDLAANLNGVAASLAEWSIAGPVAGTVNALTTATAGYRSEAEKLVAGQKALNATTTEGKAATDDLAAGVAALLDSGAIEFFDASALATAEANAEVDAILENVEKLPSAYSSVLLATESVAKATKKSWGGALDTVKSKVSSISNGMGAVAGAIGGVVGSAMGAIGFDLSSIMQAAGSAEGPKAAVKEMADGAKALIAAIPGAIKAFAAELPGVLQSLIDGIPGIIDALVSALPKLVNTIVDAVPQLVQTIVDALPVVIDAVLDALPKLIMAVIDAIPALLEAVLEAIPQIINGIVDFLPELIQAIVALIPVLIIAIIEAIPDIISSIIDAIPVIVISLVKAIVTELLPAIPKIVVALVKSAVEMTIKAMRSIAAAFLEAIGMDRKAEKLRDKNSTSYGDTPGVVEAGPQGMSARFAPRDKVVAAQTDAGLLAQVLDRVGMPGGYSSPPLTVVQQYNHKVYNDAMRDNLRMPTSPLRQRLAQSARVGHAPRS